jgi:predicted nucleic acid-binding protein
MAWAIVAEYLVDTSALARHRHPAVAPRLDELLRRGLLATCAIVDLEILFSARSLTEYRARWLDRQQAFERVLLDDRVFDRAIEVQGAMAERGVLRAVGIVDLMIAATAERAGLHYDADYDLVAEVTGQPTEWVVPRASL